MRVLSGLGALAKMLGEYVGRGRRLKDPEKCAAIRDFPPPTTLKQMQEFLGMVNLASRWMPCVGGTTFALSASVFAGP